MHYHHCPECYEKWPCDFSCTIEYDLGDGDREFGAHCICDKCEKIIHHENILKSQDPNKYKTKEFWDAYNGFVKVGYR